MKYSVILPTFHRPTDVTEFLDSMTNQEFNDFEVIIVDGSLDNSVEQVAVPFKESINLTYIYDKGLGASESRNLGCAKAIGDYLVFIDSDCIVPADYFTKIEQYLAKHDVDGFGGPDRVMDSFTPVQRAINYAMTSLLTSGGIRGKKSHVGKFHLRGFNMAVKRNVFFDVGGFSGMQVAEDIDLSMRLVANGYKTDLIADAFVYHKRKSTFAKFYKQLFMHGKGRIDLYLRHKNGLRLIHMLPSFFVVGLILGLLTPLVSIALFYVFLTLISIYTLMLFVDATIQNKSLYIGLLSTFASYELLIAYGLGLMKNGVSRILMGSQKESEKALILKH